MGEIIMIMKKTKRVALDSLEKIKDYPNLNGSIYDAKQSIKLYRMLLHDFFAMFYAVMIYVLVCVKIFGSKFNGREFR